MWLMNMKKGPTLYTQTIIGYTTLSSGIIKTTNFTHKVKEEVSQQKEEKEYHLLLPLLRGLANCLGESVATPALKLNPPLLGVCCPFRDGLPKLREVFGVWNPPNPPATFPWWLPNMGVAVGWFEDRLELPPPVKLICPSPIPPEGVKLNPFWVWLGAVGCFDVIPFDDFKTPPKSVPVWVWFCCAELFAEKLNIPPPVPCVGLGAPKVRTFVLPWFEGWFKFAPPVKLKLPSCCCGCFGKEKFAPVEKLKPDGAVVVTGWPVVKNPPDFWVAALCITLAAKLKPLLFRFPAKRPPVLVCCDALLLGTFTPAVNLKAGGLVWEFVPKKDTALFCCCCCCCCVPAEKLMVPFEEVVLGILKLMPWLWLVRLCNSPPLLAPPPPPSGFWSCAKRPLGAAWFWGLCCCPGLLLRLKVKVGLDVVVLEVASPENRLADVVWRGVVFCEKKLANVCWLVVAAGRVGTDRPVPALLLGTGKRLVDEVWRGAVFCERSDCWVVMVGRARAVVVWNPLLGAFWAPVNILFCAATPIWSEKEDCCCGCWLPEVSTGED